MLWRERTIPTTDAERAAVAKNVEAVLAATPRTLSGHDQDYDDAIKMAYTMSEQALCRPTMWEWDSDHWEWTGKWRYSDEPQTKIEK